MVKNTTGGNKAKGFARKTFTKASNALRLSNDEAEVYAQVIKVLGGAMCHVVDIEGNQMLCHIRGKFRGRGRRDNFIEIGTWVLVGMREWEKEPSKGKLLNCDMLEVYNDHDKERLKNTVTTVDWNCFISNDNKKFSSSSLEQENNEINFSSEQTEEYEAIIAMQLDEQKEGTTLTSIALGEEEINVDDI